MHLNSDAILRVTSYHRRDFDCAIITAKPGQHDYIRLSLFKILGASGNSGPGRLQCPPFELISSICLQFDLHSTLKLTQANRSAREIVASVPQCRQLSEHALECLWTLFRTGLAPHIGIATTLHSTLSTDGCVICGSFGGFISLLTAARCCFHCIESAPALRIVSLHSRCKASRAPAARLKKAPPVLRSLPGTYSSDMTRQKRRRYLVAGYHTLELLRTNEVEDPRTTLGKLPESQALRCMASTWLPYVSLATGESQLGRSCKGCQIAMEANICDENFSRRERAYSREGFLVTFRTAKKQRRFGFPAREEQPWLESRIGRDLEGY